MTTTAPQTSAAFPAWFAARQQQAWDRYLATPAPKRGDEPWRFANLKQLDFTVVGSDQGLASSPTTLNTLLMETGSRYDLIVDNFNRAITPTGVLSPHMKGKDQLYVLDKMNEFSGGSDARTNRRFNATELPEDIDADDPLMARKVLAEAGRKGFATQYGYDYSEASDSEILDNFTYNIFPNFSPWIGYLPTLVYRWLPGDTPDWCTMEIRLLFPTPKGEERPRSVECTVIPEDQPFAWAEEKMGAALANVFDQDMANLPHVQTGMKSLRSGVMELGKYQDSRVRHFQTTLMKYINGELPA